jgi:hypothetical protein
VLYVPPKGYITVYVKQDVFEQLMLLRARLRKRSVNDVIKELIKVFEVSVAGTVTTGKASVTTSVAFTSGKAGEADASKATGVASATAGESGYTSHIGVEIMSEEEAKARGITETTGTDSSTAPSTAKQSSGTSQYRKKLYRMRYEDGDESWLLQYAPDDWEKE